MPVDRKTAWLRGGSQFASIRHCRMAATKMLMSSIACLAIFILLWHYAVDSSESSGDSTAFCARKQIDIVFVAAGGAPASHIYPLIKSVIFHYHAPVTFHFVADEPARDVLATLFDTWKLPEANINFYAIENYLKEVDWIPNLHSSGVYGMTKLILDEILPRSVRKVLLLDTDTIVLDDLLLLVAKFEEMNEHQFYGLVPEISNWYSIPNPQRFVWPATDNGYNSGVALMDLDKMRASNWSTLWRSVTRENLLRLPKVNSADQDVINAVLQRMPQAVMPLSCRYNLQLGSATRKETCTGDPRQVTIAHSTGNNKRMSFETLYMSHFTRQFRAFRRSDGDHFKLRPTCTKGVQASSESNGIGRTLKYLLPCTHPNSTDDITMLIAVEFDSWKVAVDAMRAWEGPVQAVVSASDDEYTEIKEFFEDPNNALGKRSNIGLHIVFKSNQQRWNRADAMKMTLNESRTQLVYILEVEMHSGFVFSPDLYLRARDFCLRHIRTEGLAWIIPTFRLNLLTAIYPRDSNSLFRMFVNGEVKMLDVQHKVMNITDIGKPRSMLTMDRIPDVFIIAKGDGDSSRSPSLLVGCVLVFVVILTTFRQLHRRRMN